MSDRTEAVTTDRIGGREPTSHERMTGRPWDASYTDGPAPWELGGPQPAIVRLAERVRFTGPVLDAGCGLGEHAVLIAATGAPVLGVDVAQSALARARSAAAAAGVDATFEHADGLHLEDLGRTFPTVLDSGLYHTFDADERARYVASLARVVEPGGTVYLLCFGDQGPEDVPHPVYESELRAAFAPAGGWVVQSVVPERIQTRFHEHGAPAWLATLTKT